MAHPGPEGKLDQLVTLDFRMSTTCLYSDIVLPTATWYEKNDDLNTSDMHPSSTLPSTAVDPARQSKSDWEIYKGLPRPTAKSAWATWAGKRADAHPADARHPAELAQPFGVAEWKKAVRPVPGKTAPQITVVERDYPTPTSASPPWGH